MGKLTELDYKRIGIALPLTIPRAIPENLQNLRAYYWALQGMAESLFATINQPYANCEQSAMDEWVTSIRHAQEFVANQVAATSGVPSIDREERLDILLHWAMECGEGAEERRDIINRELAGV